MRGISKDIHKLKKLLDVIVGIFYPLEREDGAYDLMQVVTSNHPISVVTGMTRIAHDDGYHRAWQE